MVPVLAWDPSPYPDPRERKAFGGEQAGPGSVTLPVGRMWGFSVFDNVNNRVRAVVSRRFVGPALVKRLVYEGIFVVAADNSRATEMYLGWSESPIATGIVGTGVPFPSSAGLWESDVSSATAGFTVRKEAVQRSGSVLTARHSGEVILDRYISAPSFFLVAAMRSAQNLSNLFDGHLTLYEQVDPELALDLMG